MLPISTASVEASCQNLISSYRGPGRSAQSVIIWMDEWELSQKSYICLVGRSRVGVERRSKGKEKHGTQHLHLHFQDYRPPGHTCISIPVVHGVLLPQEALHVRISFITPEHWR